MAEIVTCFSADNASVRVETGFITVTIVSRTLISVSEGVLYRYLRSSARTAQIACCC